MNLFLQEEEVDSNMEKTENQWKKLGFVLKDGVTGVERTQQFGSKYTYNSMEDYVSGSLRDCYAILHCYRCMKKQMKTMMNMYKWEKQHERNE